MKTTKVLCYSVVIVVTLVGLPTAAYFSWQLLLSTPRWWVGLFSGFVAIFTSLASIFTYLYFLHCIAEGGNG